MNLTITYIALLGVPLLTGLLILQTKPKLTQNIKLFLSFSGAFLLATCILHLLPELYEHYTDTVGLFVLTGFILQLLLEFSSQGLEHGHLHSHNSDSKPIFPYSVFTSLFIHSFIEGMALTHGHHNHGGEPLLLAIIIHKIPIVIILVTLLLSCNLSQRRVIISVFIFCLSAPLGLALSKFLDGASISNIYYLLAIGVGIFLHISTTILFETGDGHKFNLKKVLIIIVGFLAAYIIL